MKYLSLVSFALTLLSTTPFMVTAFVSSAHHHHHHHHHSRLGFTSRSGFSTSTTTISGNLNRAPVALFMELPYGVRKGMFGLEDKETLKRVASSKTDDCVWIDVRNNDEISQQSLSQRPFIRGSYLLQDNDDDKVKSKMMQDLPDKNSHYIVFCAKGGRAKMACEKLQKNGYENVYNAGGISDIDFVV